MACDNASSAKEKTKQGNCRRYFPFRPNLVDELLLLIRHKDEDQILIHSSWVSRSLAYKEVR
jgi:hypothetical protein